MKLSDIQRPVVEVQGAARPAAEVWHTNKGTAFIVVGWPTDTSFPHHITPAVSKKGEQWVGEGVIIRAATQAEDEIFEAWENYRKGEGKQFTRAAAWDFVASYIDGIEQRET